MHCAGAPHSPVVENTPHSIIHAGTERAQNVLISFRFCQHSMKCVKACARVCVQVRALRCPVRVVQAKCRPPPRAHGGTTDAGNGKLRTCSREAPPVAVSHAHRSVCVKCVKSPPRPSKHPLPPLPGPPMQNHTNDSKSLNTNAEEKEHGMQACFGGCRQSPTAALYSQRAHAAPPGAGRRRSAACVRTRARATRGAGQAGAVGPSWACMHSIRPATPATPLQYQRACAIGAQRTPSCAPSGLRGFGFVCGWVGAVGGGGREGRF